MNKYSIGLVILMLYLVATTLALLIVEHSIKNVGYIETIGLKAYYDENCTQLATILDWGILTVNSTVTKTIYLKNIGNKPANVSWYIDNWNFTDYNGNVVFANASEYFTIEVDTVSILDTHEIAPCNITLIVYDVDYVPFYNFSFHLHLIGEYT